MSKDRGLYIEPHSSTICIDLSLHLHEKYIYSILARKERKERKKERSYHPPHIPLSKYIYETDNTCTYIGRTPGAQP